jgi:hypothetical protein
MSFRQRPVRDIAVSEDKLQSDRVLNTTSAGDTLFPDEPGEMPIAI